MTFEITPRSFFRFPAMWDDDQDWMLPAMGSAGSGLSVSEDDAHVFVEAALPGLDPKQIDVTFNKGVLWIKGERAEEEKDRKFYRRAARSFSYQVAVPGNIDEKAEPEAQYQDGVMSVTFKKRPEEQPKKIAVKKK